MNKSRVEIIDFGEFDAREWLRREVLWASLIVPYTQQLACWNDGTALAHHNGNVSRRDIYNVPGDCEMESLSFFNQGKNIASMVSQSSLFRACMVGHDVVDLLNIQAMSVDKVVQGSAEKRNPINETEAYLKSTHLVNKALESQGQYGSNHRFLWAAQMMTRIASQEAEDWVNNSYQNNEGSLPQLNIRHGGHPRSAGPRVKMLQPIFNKIIESESYIVLQTSLK